MQSLKNVHRPSLENPALLARVLPAAMADFAADAEARPDPLADVALKDIVDASSCANCDEYRVTHVLLELEVDMQARAFDGHCTLSVERLPECASDELVLDAHESMAVDGVVVDGARAKFECSRYCDFGSRLVVFLPKGFVAGDVDVSYRTSGEPAATWLDAKQAGGQPFVFTMGQACLNRSLFPCQDTPRVRITWAAKIRAPEPFVVVAAAELTKRSGVFWEFEMKTSVPAYLVALAVGDLAKRDVGPRSAVYAHPALVDAAAAEFAGVTEKYLKAGEELFGEYRWGRYDLLMMPFAFAYGGMENPRLTFLSPTLVVGDGSLTDTVAHEIAHSWFGNLVTNRSWAEFYLNEGFTMYAQRRITRLVDGAAITDLEALVGWRLLENEVLVAQDGGGLFSRLRVPIDFNVDPDDTYNDVPYEKGYALLCEMRDRVVETSLEPLVEFKGDDARDAALDPWLRRYLRDHAFTCVDTPAMLAHFAEFHPAAFLMLDAARWLDGEGLPESTPPQPHAKSLTAPADAAVDGIARGDAAALAALADAWPAWPTYQRSYLLDALVAREDELPRRLLYELGRSCGLSGSKNAELTMRWALLVLKEGLELRDDDVERHLKLTAKQKFVLPVFRALFFVDAPRAKRLFKAISSGLDCSVRKKLERILKAAPPDLQEVVARDSSLRELVERESATLADLLGGAPRKADPSGARGKANLGGAPGKVDLATPGAFKWSVCSWLPEHRGCPKC